MAFKIPKFINFKLLLPAISYGNSEGRRRPVADMTCMCSWRIHWRILSLIWISLIQTGSSDWLDTFYFHIFKALKVPKLPRKRFINPHFGIPELVGCPSFEVICRNNHEVSLVWGPVLMCVLLATGAKTGCVLCLSSAVHVPRIVILLITTIVTKSLCSRLVGFGFNF